MREVLGIVLDAEQRAAVDEMDPSALAKLLEAIKAARAWPA